MVFLRIGNQDGRKIRLGDILPPTQVGRYEPLGSWATVYQAEINAISMCMVEITRRALSKRRIHVFSIARWH